MTHTCNPAYHCTSYTIELSFYHDTLVSIYSSVQIIGNTFVYFTLHNHFFVILLHVWLLIFLNIFQIQFVNIKIEHFQTAKFMRAKHSTNTFNCIYKWNGFVSPWYCNPMDYEPDFHFFLMYKCIHDLKFNSHAMCSFLLDGVTVLFFEHLPT